MVSTLTEVQISGWRPDILTSFSCFLSVSYGKNGSYLKLDNRNFSVHALTRRCVDRATDNVTNWLRGARTRRFVTAYTTALHNQSNPIHSLYLISLRSILSPSSHLQLRVPSGSLSFELSHQKLVHFSLSCVPHALPTSFAFTWSA
jgi:hypothetical protein